MEKSLVKSSCLNDARGFPKEERMMKMMNWLSSNDEN
jgi:hypothetical protein